MADDARSRLFDKYGLGGGAPAAPAAPDDPYGFIDEAADRHGVPRDLMRGMARQESSFRPDARSPKGALGMFQFMPETARAFGLRVDDTVDERLDPARSADAAGAFISHLYDKYGDYELALAAYNAGEPKVDAAGGIPDIPETQDYVQKIYGRMQQAGTAPPPVAPGAFERLNARFGLQPEKPSPGYPAGYVPPMERQPSSFDQPGYLERVAGGLATGEFQAPPPEPGPSGRPPIGRFQSPLEMIPPGSTKLATLPAPVTPIASEQFQRRQRQLAEWWHAGGQTMRPEEIAALGPDYEDYAAYARGERPGLELPPTEREMRPPQLAQALGEQFITGAMQAAIPGARNVPSFVDWYRSAGATGPLGTAAHLGGSAVGFAAPTPGPILANKAGQAAFEATIGQGVQVAVDQARRAVLETAFNDLVRGGADASAAMPQATRFANAWAMALMKERAGRAAYLTAEYGARPIAAGAALGAVEGVAGLATGQTKPEELPASIANSAAGFVIAHVGFNGLAALLRSSGLAAGDIVDRLRRGDSLSPDEETMMRGFAERVRQASEARRSQAAEEARTSQARRKLLDVVFGPRRGSQPQPGPSGAVPPEEAQPIYPGFMPPPGEAGPEPVGPARTPLDDYIEGVQSALAPAPEAPAAAAARAPLPRAPITPEDPAEAQRMAQIEDQARWLGKFLTEGEIRSMNTTEDMERLVIVAKARRLEEERRRLTGMAQAARARGEGVIAPLPEPAPAPEPTPQPPPAPAPLPEAEEPPIEMPTLAPALRRNIAAFLQGVPRMPDDEVMRRAEQMFGSDAVPYVMQHLEERSARAGREKDIAETLKNANPEERAALARGQNRQRIADAIKARMAREAAAGANLPPSSGLGHQADIEEAKRLLGGAVETERPAPAPPSAPPPAAPPAQPQGEPPAPRGTPPAAPARPTDLQILADVKNGTISGRGFEDVPGVVEAMREREQGERADFSRRHIVENIADAYATDFHLLGVKPDKWMEAMGDMGLLEQYPEMKRLIPKFLAEKWAQTMGTPPSAAPARTPRFGQTVTIDVGEREGQKATILSTRETATATMLRVRFEDGSVGEIDQQDIVTGAKAAPAPAPPPESHAPGPEPAGAPAPPERKSDTQIANERRARMEKLQAQRKERIRAEVGNWMKMLLDDVGPIRIDTKKQLAAGGSRDVTTRSIHSDTIKVLNDAKLGMVPGMFVSSKGVPIDEAAAHLAARGYMGGNEKHARDGIIDMLMKLASEVQSGKFRALAKSPFGPPMEDIGGSAITRVMASDLEPGDEFLVQDGTYWTVRGKTPEAITLEGEPGETLKIDPGEPIPTIGGVTKARGGTTVAEPRDEYFADLPPDASFEEMATKSFETADGKLKAVMLRLVAHHMRAGVRDLDGMRVALVKELDDRVLPYVDGAFRMVSKMPAFRQRAAAPPTVEPQPPTEPTEKEAPSGSPQPEPVPPGPQGAGGGGGVPGTGRERPGRGPRPPRQPRPPAPPKPTKPSTGAPTRELKGGIATISRELLPPLEPQYQALYDQLTGPAAMESAKKLFGRRPMEHQIEDFVRIKRAFDQDKGYIVANGTGTGKTFSAGLAIQDLFLQNKDGRVMTLVPNETVMNQWASDVLTPLGVKTHLVKDGFRISPTTVNFMTYTRLALWSRDDLLGLIEGFAPDLLIFDEAHALRNFFKGKTERAKAGEYISHPDVSKHTLFMSATPFSSFTHTAYLGATQVWRNRIWLDWLARDFGIVQQPDGTWSGASPKVLRQMHEAFYRAGVMSRHDLDFAGLKNSKDQPVTLTSENLIVPMSEAQQSEYDRLDSAFESAIESLTKTSKGTKTRVRLIRSLQHMVRRSMDESVKLPRAIEHAKQQIAQGHTALFFLLRRESTDLERMYNEYIDGDRTYGPKSHMPDILSFLAGFGIKVPSPVALLKAAFPGAVAITGAQPSGSGMRQASIDALNSGQAKIGIITLASGAESLSLHDKIGTHPRDSYVASVPYTAQEAMQAAGRGFRLGSESSANIRWLFTDSAQDMRQARVLASTLFDAGALLNGKLENVDAAEKERFHFRELNVDPMPDTVTIAPYEDAVDDFDISEPKDQYGLFGPPTTPGAANYRKAALRTRGLVTSANSVIQMRVQQTGEFFRYHGAAVATPDDFAAMMQAIKDRPTEVCYVIYTKGGVPLGAEMIGMGTINTAQTEPRVALSGAVVLGADGVALAHNHPSGSPQASAEDMELTRTYARIFAAHGMRLHGHVVVDLDDYGWIEHDGLFTIRKVPAQIGLAGTDVPALAARQVRTGKPGEPLRSPDEALARFTADLQDPSQPAVAFYLTDTQNRIIGNLHARGTLDEILRSKGATQRLRQLLARTMAKSVLVGTTEPLQDAGSALQSLRDFLGSAGSPHLMDVVSASPRALPGEHYRSGRAAGWELRTREPRPAVGEPRDLKSRAKMVDELIASVESRLQVGRMGSIRKTVRGFYSAQTGVVNARGRAKVETVAHEIGHRLDQFIFGLGPTGQLGSASNRQMRQFRSELLPIATRPRAGHDPIQEGFAEFVRLYVVDEARARRVAPRFYPFFVQRMNQPDMAKIHEALLGVRQDYENYGNATWKERIGSLIVSPATPGQRYRRGMTWSDIYKYVFDDMHFMRKLSVQMERLNMGQPVAPEENGVILATTLKGRWGIVDAMLNHGMTSFSRPGVKTGPSAKELAAVVGRRMYDYDIYSVSRRALDLKRNRGWDPMRAVGMTEADARAAFADGHADFGLTFKKVQRYFNGLTDYLYEAGMLSAENRDRMRRANPDYAPLWRLVDSALDDPRFQGAVGGTLGNLWSPLKTIKGSDYPIIPTFEAMTKMTYLVVDRAERNAVLSAFVRRAQMIRGAGVDFATIVPMEKWPITISVDSIKQKLKDLGVDPDAIDDIEGTITLFIDSLFPPPRPYAWTWRNGKRQLAWINPDLYDSVMGLDRDTLPTYLRFLEANAKLLRAGAVALDIGFWPWSMTKDLQTTWLHTESLPKQIAFLGQSLVDALFKTERYWKFQKSGAAFGTFLKSDAIAIGRRFARDQKRSNYPWRFWANPLNWMRETLAFLQHVGQSMELAPRISEARIKGLDQAVGRSQMLTAGYAGSEITQDFRRQGVWPRSYGRIAAFLGATLGGLDRPVREMRNRFNDIRNEQYRRPLWFASNLAMLMTAGAMYYLLTREDPRYDDIPQEQRDLYWHFFVPGTDLVLRIPKGYAYGYVATFVERGMEAIDRDDPRLMGQFAQDATKDLLPTTGLLPTGTQALLEVAMNENLRTGRPIMPDRGLPGERYYPWTTETAKALGRAAHLSPAGIEYVGSQWTGGMGLDTVRMIERYAFDVEPARPETASDLPVIGRWTARYPTIGGDAYRRFYETITPARQAWESWRTKLRNEPAVASKFYEENKPAIDTYFRLRGYESAIRGNVQLLRQMEASKVDDATKVAQGKRIAAIVNGLASQALGMEQRPHTLGPVDLQPPQVGGQ